MSSESNEILELRVEKRGERVQLCSPAVGSFTEAREERCIVQAGEFAGTLLVLGRALRLRVPEGVYGRVVTPRRERVQAPVGWGEVLYELEPVGDVDASAREASKGVAGATNALVLRSPQSGRFYHRSAPGAAAFVDAGQVLADGQPVGLIEVMKTFAHVTYRAGGTLPARARLVRHVAADGAEVRAGDVLLELAPE